MILFWNESNSVTLSGQGNSLMLNSNNNLKRMKKIRAAVVGYGNIGKFTLEALEAAPDFEVAGIVRRNGDADKPAELADYQVVKDIKELKDVDVAILATPTRSVEKSISILRLHLCVVRWMKQLKNIRLYLSFRPVGIREVIL